MPLRPSLRPQNALFNSISRQAIWMRADGVERRHEQYTQSYGPRFTYRLGASASGKSSRLLPPDHGQNFWTQTVVQREPSFFSSVQRFSGEDAFFMSHVAKSERHVVFGIADGVGGWQDQGVNPAKFSHGLCKYMAEATFRPEREQDLKPVNVLQKGYDRVISDRSIAAGGSTASVATLEPSGQMEAANLGDSGFVILQPGKVAYRSEAQTHAFNTPYQLSKLTAQMQAQRAIFGGATQISESPSASDVSNHTLRHGDVVLFGTDGLWDNLSAMEVHGIVSSTMEKQGYWTAGAKSDNGSQESLVNAGRLRKALAKQQPPADDLPGHLAYAVMRAAKVASHDMRRDGPFAKEVHRAYPGEQFHGGKVDDICVIVCIAVQDGDASANPEAKL